MKILNVTQGSPEWGALRARHHTASEAPAMMGTSRHVKRSDLLHMKATGSVQEFSAWEQENLIDRGHEVEAAARAIVEGMIGEDLYPATIADDAGYLLASLDGLTMDGGTGFECKSWNEDLAKQVRAKELDPHYFWQLEQQILVSGMEKVIFVVSDGTEDKFEWMEYRAVPGRADQLMRGWRQFDEDLANYSPAEVLPAVKGKSLIALPSLSIELSGEVRSSNLAIYKDRAIAFIESVNTDLQTDQDFADADTAVKFFTNAEKEVETVKRMALAQTATIDELFSALDHIRDLMREKRLALNKLVEKRKATIRDEILAEGVTKFKAHIAALNTRIGKPYMPDVPVKFAEVMKGKRTVSSLRDAVDTELARAKIEANEIADRIDLNLKTLAELAKDHLFLFSDERALVLKSHDDLTIAVKHRIAEHREAETRKKEAEAKAAEKAAATPAVPTPTVPAPLPRTAPSAVVTPLPTAPKPAERPGAPSGEQLVEVLALHYRVHEVTVLQWLVDLDLDALGRHYSAEFA